MVRESARRITCANNIRQLGLALHNYESAHQHLPYGWDGGGFSWGVEILPFIEQNNLFGMLERGSSWTSNGSACCGNRGSNCPLPIVSIG